MNSKFKFTTCLVTLLNFYKTGDVQTFRVLLKRTISYLSLEVHENEFKSFSNIIFDRLSIFGIIEKANYKGRTIWEFCGTSIICIGSDNHIFVGDRLFINDVIKSLDQTIVEHRLYGIQKKYLSGEHAICFPKAQIKKEKLRLVLSFNDKKYADINNLKFLRILPSIESVASNIVPESSDFVPEEYSLSIFNFEKNDWLQSKDWSIKNIGFYKIANDFGRPIFFIKNTINELFRVKDRDWAFFLACYILNIKIGLAFDSKSEVLKIPYSSFRHFPVILKRTLTIQSFTWPKYEKSMYHITQINKDVINTLIKKITIFRISKI